MKTSELTDAALDWAVATCEGAEYKEGFLFWYDHEGAKRQIKPYPYSTDWGQGGPIIEREQINISYCNPAAGWSAQGFRNAKFGPTPLIFRKAKFGPTPLIAAMRSYVASKLGAEIDVPEGIA